MTTFSDTRRQQYLGASDVPAVCGVDPETTAADVWAEKTGRDPGQRKTDLSDGRSPIVLGKYLEGGILNWVRDRLDCPLISNEWITDNTGWRACTLDARTARQPMAIVECKTCGLLGRPSYYDDYGPDGTDQVPVHVLVQLHYQADVARAAGRQVDSVAYVAALLGGKGMALYPIALSEELMREIRASCEEFRQLWQADQCPDAHFSLAVARRLERVPDLVLKIPNETVSAWIAAKAAQRDAEHAAKEAEQALWTALGAAERGDSDLGQVAVQEIRRSGYTVQPAAYRQLRFTDTATLNKRAEKRARKLAREQVDF